MGPSSRVVTPSPPTVPQPGSAGPTPPYRGADTPSRGRFSDVSIGEDGTGSPPTTLLPPGSTPNPYTGIKGGGGRSCRHEPNVTYSEDRSTWSVPVVREEPVRKTVSWSVVGTVRGEGRLIVERLEKGRGRHLPESQPGFLDVDLETLSRRSIVYPGPFGFSPLFCEPHRRLLSPSVLRLTETGGKQNQTDRQTGPETETTRKQIGRQNH